MDNSRRGGYILFSENNRTVEWVDVVEESKEKGGTKILVKRGEAHAGKMKGD